MRALWICAALSGCSSAPEPVARPAPPLPPPAAAAPIDAGGFGEEQQAAVVLAMNQLDEVAQQCWAAAAVERFDIQGELSAEIAISASSARSTIVSDTVRQPKLARCLTGVLDAYRWAPPLHGQTIRLPFRFRAPDGQNVIDRALVPWNGQGKLSVAVLLDQHNTGNGAASMVELAIDAGGSTGMRSAERAELWLFLGPATVSAPKTKPIAVTSGDMMFAPARSVREVKAGATAVHAVIVIAPGGPEGSARAGALATPEQSAIDKGARGPMVLPAAKASQFPRPAGSVRIYAEPSTIKDSTLAASMLELPAGAQVPEHVHANETEMLYVLEGSGTMTVAGVELAVTPTSVVQIPAGTKHAFKATAAVRTLQVYTPAGPEQRFKAKP
jgi:quercetin dioxygenase-like cupin family protein